MLSSKHNQLNEFMAENKSLFEKKVLILTIVLFAFITAIGLAYFSSPNNVLPVAVAPTIAPTVEPTVMPTPEPTVILTPVPSIDTLGWKKYRNEEYGFGFEYDSNWQLEEKNNSIELKPIVNDKPEEISISVNTINNRPKDYTLAGWLLQTGNKNAPCSFTKMINEINWCGVNTERFEAVRVDDYAMTKNNIDYDVQFRVAYGRQRIDYYISDKELSKEINALDQILSTFKFIK